MDLLDGKAFHQCNGIILSGLPCYWVDRLKKLDGIHIPAPPNVARQGLQFLHLLRIHRLQQHLLPTRLVVFLVDHLVHHVSVRDRFHHVMPPARLLESHVPSLLIAGYQVFPKQFFGHLQSRFRNFKHLALAHFEETAQGHNDVVNHLVIVAFLTASHNNGFVIRDFLLDKLSKARHVRGHCRDAQRNAFERCVAPRLVIRWENRKVKSREEIGVGHVEYAIVAIEVSWHKHHFHLVVAVVLQSKTTQGIQNRIVFIFKDMVRCREIGVPHDGIATIQPMLQVFRRASNVGWHGNHRHNRSRQVLVFIEAAQGFDIQVDALVSELIASAIDDHQAVAVDRFAAQGFGNMKNLLARIIAFFGKSLCILTQRMVNAVHRHLIRLAIKELLAFLRRDVAHRRESIGVFGRLLLHRLLRNDIELHGHHRRQIRLQVFVERHSIA